MVTLFGWNDVGGRYFNDCGNLQEIQSLGRDVTEYKKTEEALMASEEDLRRKNLE
jgi:hypothetical protein